MSNHPDTLFTFYARDREHEEEKAAAILVEHPCYERLDLKEYPRGFTFFQVHLTGTREEAEDLLAPLATETTFCQ